MIKKYFITILSAILSALIMLCSLPLAGCNPAGGDVTTPTTTTPEATTAPDPDRLLYIVKDGVCEYSIMRADIESKTSAKAGAALKSAIESVGGSITLGTEWAKPGDPAPEIGKTLVVGQVKDAKAEAVYTGLGENDYTVTVRDEAVYIVGGSQLATYYAWMHFRDNFIDTEAKTVAIPASYAYTFRGAVSREDYIKNPDLFLVNWVTEFEAPAWMTDYNELVASLSDPDGRMMCSGHRADFSNYPENSIEGIISCIRMGADNVELDLWVTKDDVVVLMHDNSLGRTTDFSDKGGRNGLPTSALIADWTYAELQQLNLKMNDGTLTEYKIPTFKEAVTVCRDRITIRCDKMTGLADWQKYIWPTMVECQAYKTCILNYHIGLSDALAAMRKWSVTSNGELPFYFGKINSANAQGWGLYYRSLLANKMIQLVRWTDFNPNADIPSGLSSCATSLGLVKGTLRIYVDAHQNAKQETPEMWDLLLENGVNFILVNDPLELCKYIAEKYAADYADWKK